MTVKFILVLILFFAALAMPAEVKANAINVQVNTIQGNVSENTHQAVNSQPQQTQVVEKVIQVVVTATPMPIPTVVYKPIYRMAASIPTPTIAPTATPSATPKPRKAPLMKPVHIDQNMFQALIHFFQNLFHLE
jgi:hypothetical protein